MSNEEYERQIALNNEAALRRAETDLISLRLELAACESQRVKNNAFLLAELETATTQRALDIAENARLSAALAAAKELNAERIGRFVATEQHLATQLALYQEHAEAMAEDLECMRRGIDWSTLCAAPSEPALVMWEKFLREKP